MAKTTVVHLTDDIDGSDAAETVTFALDGTSYEIDLNEAHAADLRDVLAPYVGAARKAATGGRRASTTGTPSQSRPRSRASSGDSSAPDPREVRTWAEANGVAVSPRGRIKADVLEQYRAANA